MKVKIEIDCETIGEIISHCYEIIKQVKNSAKKAGMDHSGEFETKISLYDDNCYGSHEVGILPEDSPQPTPDIREGDEKVRWIKVSKRLPDERDLYVCEVHWRKNGSHGVSKRELEYMKGFPTFQGLSEGEWVEKWLEEQTLVISSPAVQTSGNDILIWKIIDHFQVMRLGDDECTDRDEWSDKVLSYNDVETELYSFLGNNIRTTTPTKEEREVKKRAVEFAIWILNEGYVPDSQKGGWYKIGGSIKVNTRRLWREFAKDISDDEKFAQEEREGEQVPDQRGEDRKEYEKWIRKVIDDEMTDGTKASLASRLAFEFDAHVSAVYEGAEQWESDCKDRDRQISALQSEIQGYRDYLCLAQADLITCYDKLNHKGRNIAYLIDDILDKYKSHF